MLDRIGTVLVAAVLVWAMFEIGLQIGFSLQALAHGNFVPVAVPVIFMRRPGALR